METLLSSASMYSTHSLTNSSTHKAALVGEGLIVCRLHTRTRQPRIDVPDSWILTHVALNLFSTTLKRELKLNQHEMDPLSGNFFPNFQRQ